MREFVVTLKPGASLEAVVARLAELGLADLRSLADMHMIIGAAPPEAAARLRQVEGVATVEAGQTIQLSPGDPQ
jgi:hypothetical protein